ncbi:diguanylate cyclase [Pseudohongiella acticola]|uniref:Diguanylate cyclase n=1 Tax=Pseudohongiella acticola TaxID=1524254 RepID=A0A1E8CM74_9GAMM|nr:EAL domain-containing protein [Pseudohongiella acticola]OFE13571.1 diguanylate cyclase [Pseudohongiella acticola]
MENTEELREIALTMRREIDLLRTETTHANVLLTALDTLLCVDGDTDPFIGVFSALMPVFECTSAIVLMEQDEANGDPEWPLECVAASDERVIGSSWRPVRLFRKVISGRIISTVGNTGIDEWPPAIAEAYSGDSPALVLPLMVRDHRGLMMLLRKPEQAGFNRDHVTLARKFSLLASHAFAARQANLTVAESHRLRELTARLRTSEEALRFRANHDQLTGLPNRSYIQELVSGKILSKQKGQKLALAFIDLDEFKSVNDLHGHAAGDALLREIALRIRSEIRSKDVVGRISGDEFVIAFDPIRSRTDIRPIIKRVRDRLQQSFSVYEITIKPSASIGISLYPEHGSDYETLRRHADMAMYHAKTDSKGSIAYFTLDLGRQTAKRLTLEKQLRAAITNRQFRCALQKKFDIRSGAIVGFEMLARWVEAKGKIRGPGEFLPLASELGLLDDITMCVLGDLVSRLPELDARFGPLVEYSLNVSPIQTTNIPFMLELAKQLDAHNGRRFFLELTEEALASIDSLENHILPVLRSTGIRLSIDDFGTGYSSLATLAALTVDEVKIDMSLITSIHERSRNQVIVRAIESLGSALDISIVAEGIESSEENEFLLSNTSLTIGQGYLFHKPQLLDDLLESASEAAATKSL